MKENFSPMGVVSCPLIDYLLPKQNMRGKQF
jgi:hypothetical protein